MCITCTCFALKLHPPIQTHRSSREFPQCYAEICTKEDFIQVHNRCIHVPFTAGLTVFKCTLQIDVQCGMYHVTCLMHFHTHKYTCTCTLYSDQAYHTRIILASLDHNMHIDCPIAGGNHAQYHRVFRKRTKHWDVVPVKERKAFSYNYSRAYH